MAWEEICPLHSPCPHPSGSKQMVHGHRNSSIWPFGPPLPSCHPANVYVPCMVLGMQALSSCPAETFILVRGTTNL